MGNYSLGERLQYWLDKRMAKGAFNMIKALITATVVFVVLLSVLALVIGIQGEGGFLSILWDMFVTTIDEEWPRSEDGSVGYIVLSSLAAAVGLLFTSVLIGIITSAIEERLAEMRKGTTKVLEKGHTVILGFHPGEYAIISETIAGFGGKKGTIIVAEQMPREQMENLIYENVDIPDNVDVICRSIDIEEPTDLRCCSPIGAKAVLIAPTDNEKTLKTALSVETILSEQPDCPTKVLATVSSSRYVIQRRMFENKHLIMLQTSDLIARLIAHCSTMPGLSGVFSDIFDYEGNEFYEEEVPGTIGKTFGEVVQIANGGSVIGISDEDGIRINPDPGTRIRAKEKLVYFAENKGDVSLEENYDYDRPVEKETPAPAGEKNLIIIGYNEAMRTILQELPERRYNVLIVTKHVAEARKDAERIRHRGEISVQIEDLDVSDISVLEGAVSPMNYIVLLNDPMLDDDAADTEILLLLLKLHDIREQLQLDFSVTAEMRREKNRNLVFLKDPTDFIISSNIASMIMTQIARNYRLKYLFNELLSNKGSEIYLRYASSLGCAEKGISMREVRHRALEYGYLVLGYMKKEKDVNRLYLNPDAKIRVTLGENDHLVVVGKK